MRRFLSICLSLGGVLAVVFYARVLSSAGSLLVCDDAAVLDDATCVVPYYGDRQFDVCVELVGADADGRVLVLRGQNFRSVEIGVQPSSSDYVIQGLERRGIEPYAITILDGHSRSFWDTTRILDGWLKANPKKNVLMLSSELNTRSQRWIIDYVMPPDRARRVSFRPLVDRRYGSADWWKSRRGLKAAFGAYFNLFYTVVFGEAVVPPQMTADQYEAEVVALLKNTSGESQ